VIKVIIAEDEKAIREGLVATVPWAALGFEVSGSASNGQAALDLAEREKPAVVITDIRMPKMDGIQLLRELKARLPRAKVVILSGYDEFSYAQQAIKHGASDFLVKPVNVDEVVEAMKRIKATLLEELIDSPPPPLQAQAPESHAAALSVGTELAASPTSSAAAPSADDHRLVRQAEEFIAKHYRRDISVKEVADLVGLSPNYFSHLFKKTNGASFTEYVNAVRVAQARRLLAESDLKIYEIAETVGYTDYKYFSAVFTKLAGASPTRYRPERGAPK
jgi:two-component system response regulator YesN